MNNLRAFYAKTTELKNQFKLDFTFDSIDLIGHEIEQTFHFSKIGPHLNIYYCLLQILNESDRLQHYFGTFTPQSMTNKGFH